MHFWKSIASLCLKNKAFISTLNLLSNNEVQEWIWIGESIALNVYTTIQMNIKYDCEMN